VHKRSALTELEGCVLGVIGARGPCTPYAVRREFQASPSQHWSASAGAIYPLIQRLRRRRWIRLEGKTGDGRKGKLYVLTAAGRQVLRGWLGPPSTPFAISVPLDPVRDRVGFLGMLPPLDQAAFVTDALERLRAHLLEIDRYAAQTRAAGDVFEEMVSDGARRMVEARIAWLGDVAQRLGIPTSIHQRGIEP
jgi:DNA-binding PadR family transcriptional regulator